MAITESQSLLTAEQFLLIDDGRYTELERGRIVDVTPPNKRHGEVCINVAVIVSGFVREHRLGRMTSNDSGVITERDPDSVRGPDVAFYSFKRVPDKPLPSDYSGPPPDVVFEVRSPNDRWSKITEKMSEFLLAGVNAVCVLDPETETILVQRANEPPRTIGPDADLALPEIAESFRVPVRRFFE